jgi:hypothetical protein
MRAPLFSYFNLFIIVVTNVGLWINRLMALYRIYYITFSTYYERLFFVKRVNFFCNCVHSDAQCSILF